MLKFVVEEGALVNINGLNYKFNKGVPWEIPTGERPKTCEGCGYIEAYKTKAEEDKGPKRVSPCFGNYLKLGDLCESCDFKIDCKQSRDYTEQMKKDYYKNYFVSEIKTEKLKSHPYPLPNCFGYRRTYRDQCQTCSYDKSCKVAYDKIGSVTIKEVVKPVPNCFSSKNPLSTCSSVSKCYTCTYISQCKKVYDMKDVVAPTCFCISYSEKSCNHDCSYKYSCKKVYDKIEEKIKVPGCFGTKVESGCQDCSHIHPCKRYFDKIYKRTKIEQVTIPVPACFSSLQANVLAGCVACSYKGPCKKAYNKIAKDKKLTIDKMLRSIVDTVSKNMKDPLKQPSKMPWEG